MFSTFHIYFLFFLQKIRLSQSTYPPLWGVRLLLATALCSLIFSPLPLCAREAKSRYVTLHYGSQQLLDNFNENLELGNKFKAFARSTPVVTVQDEVLAKIDMIVEKAETVLEMFPDQLHIHIVLLAEAGDVAELFKGKYGKDVDHIAFYSLSEDAIYISVDDAELRVLAHEIGHAIVDHYFKVRPPYNVHELMAQFVEKRVTE